MVCLVLLQIISKEMVGEGARSPFPRNNQNQPNVLPRYYELKCRPSHTELNISMDIKSNNVNILKLYHLNVATLFWMCHM